MVDPKALAILKQLVSGTHDPTPTRHMPFHNKEAMEVDSWWDDYFRSMYDRHRQMAREMLEILNKENDAESS